MNHKTASRPGQGKPVVRWLIGAALLVAAVAVFAACQPMLTPAPGEAAVATEAAATEAAATEAAATEAPMAEATEAATEEPAAEEAEAAATAAPAEEAASDASGVAIVGDPARGGYIFAATTGCGCHFNRDLGGPAGGNKFEGPFGVVYASNITSDPETGLGNWTDQQIVDAMRLGKDDEGRTLFPAMPYHDWSVMADQDVYDLVAAMRQIPPIKNDVPETELTNPLPEFVPAAPPPAVAPTEGVERGAYLAALGRCASCHTPRTETGAPDTTKLFGGAQLQDTIAPNLTPDELNGIGAVSDADIVHFLLTGEYEDGSKVDGPMEQVINNGTSKLTEADVNAIVAYLRSLPPVDNAPQ